MIVDDAASVVVMVQKYLKEAGFSRFLTTSDATQALPMIYEGAPDTPDHRRWTLSTISYPLYLARKKNPRWNR